MENIIEVEMLCKNYANVEAVRGISFTVKKGAFFAFLGENGAGKSTTINIISTLLSKTSGEVVVCGGRVDDADEHIRRSLGAVFQDSMLDKHLTVRENIVSRGRMYGLAHRDIEKRITSLSTPIGLMGFLDRRYGKLSGGQKRRADIARALINQPRVLILDEPTTGLDPKTRQSVWGTIRKLQSETKLTVFLTTHYMEEAAAADHIVVINNGQICAEGSPESLRRKYSADRLIITPKHLGKMIRKMKNVGHSYQQDGETINVCIGNAMDAIDIVTAVRDDIETFEVIHGSMEDVFIHLTDGDTACGGADNA